MAKKTALKRVLMSKKKGVVVRTQAKSASQQKKRVYEYTDDGKQIV